MSLRYRLFLMVSGIFIVVAACSFFMENYVFEKGMQSAQKNLRSKILDLSEKQRVDLQNFLASALAEIEERINAVLVNLSSFTPQVLRFGPTAANLQKGTWDEAADLLVEYKWIDFLQNTNQGKITAAITPKRSDPGIAYRIEIDQELCWVYVKDSQGIPIAYLGVRVPYTMINRVSTNPLEIPDTMTGVTPEVYALFDLHDMMSNAKQYAEPIFQKSDELHWPSIPVKWTEGYALEMGPLVAAFQRARQMLLTGQLVPPKDQESEILEKMDGLAAVDGEQISPIPIQTLLSGTTAEAMAKSLEEIALNYTRVSMIWGLIALFDSGAFGDDLFHFPSPYAITLFGSGKLVGVNIDSKDVFSSEKLFDDQAYYQSNSPKNPNSNISSSLAVITSPNSKNIYLGNTAQFIVRTPSEDGVGYLTLGVDVDIFLRRLVFGAHQMAILVHEGQPLSVYSEEGKRLELDSKFNLPFAEMLHQKLGIVSWNEKSYFFMHLQPFPTVDLHFFLLNPEEIQFAWIREFQNSTKEIVDRILFDMHLAGLGALVLAILLVHRISRKITKPIIQLAQATKEVAQGRLDDVQLSLPPLKHQDEVAMLCHSFEEMVKGLKEKEKVKGVLNKVVSTEIAQEILKGNVHLGGEEKKVTVLFADIREFTKMTQNMAPQQVIELLNSCMTKISCSIDQNGGVIDKFVGDEAMALFGAPISKEDAAFKAVLSAVEMQEALKNWNLERVSKGMPAIEMGIGIHTGEMLAGNMGAENRLNYTVIGSNVNLAARLCNAAKRMEILITKDTLNEPFVKDRFIYESMPPITLKGFDKQVEVFSVKGIKR